MKFPKKNREWHAKEETQSGGYSGYKTSSNISGCIIPKNQGTGRGITGPGPNTTKELSENSRSGPRDRGTRHLAY